MPIPQPTRNETEAEFVKRAHDSMISECPDAELRNAKIFKAWDSARGESDLQRKAYAKFPDSQFAHIEYVPAFKEHEYPRIARERNGQLLLDDDGNPQTIVEKYDFNALRSICDNLNYRIADTGDFSPITDKHSPRSGSEESKPGILGFAGPFRLGMIGNKEPKWAILASEHWFRDKSHLAREMPRRSAEVYLGRPMEERILDPIAALGADTPALDMGIHYSQEASGELVACYSGPPILARYNAACFPGGANAAPPKEVELKRKYSDNPKPTEAEMAISPEDVNTIVQAIMQLEPMQWVISKMEADKAPRDDSSDDIDAPPDQEQQLSEEESPAVDDDDSATEGDDADMANDKKNAQYANREFVRDLTAKYAADHARLEALEVELANTRKRAVIDQRRAKLANYRAMGFDLDVSEEMQRCSLERMNEDAFQDHLDVIVKHYSRLPIGVTLHTPDMPEELEPRHKSVAGGNGRAKEPSFVGTEEFFEEVQSACYAEQCKPDYDPNDKTFYQRIRQQVIDKRLAKAKDATAAKVG
jgi:hypothetical protein